MKELLSLAGFNRMSRALLPQYQADQWGREGLRLRAGLAVRAYRYLSDLTRTRMIRTHRHMRPMPMATILEDAGWDADILGPPPKVAEGGPAGCPGCGGDLPPHGFWVGAVLAISTKCTVFSTLQFAEYAREMVDELATELGEQTAIEEVRRAGGWRADLLGTPPSSTPGADEIKVSWQYSGAGEVLSLLYVQRSGGWEENLKNIYLKRGRGLIDLDGIPGNVEPTDDPDHPVKFVPIVEVQGKVALAS